MIAMLYAVSPKTTAAKALQPKPSNPKNIMSSTGRPRNSSMVATAGNRSHRGRALRQMASRSPSARASGAATTAARSVAPRPTTSSERQTSDAVCRFGGA